MFILDRFDDGNGLLAAIEKKAAYRFSLPTKGSAFADDYAIVLDSGVPKLPLTTKDEALASALYFSRYGGNLSNEQRIVASEKLASALESFGVGSSEKLASLFSLPLGYSNKEGKDINDIEELSLAVMFGLGRDSSIEMLGGEFAKASPSGKRKLAFTVKEAGLEVPAAYLSTEFGADLVPSIKLRGFYLEDETLSASLLEKVASLDPEAAVDAVLAFDIEHNICRLYELKDLPDPYQTVFGNSVEKLAFTTEAVEVNGDYISPDRFADILGENEESLVRSFGRFAYDALAANPREVFPSLPDPHKDIVNKLIG